MQAPRPVALLESFGELRRRVRGAPSGYLRP